jgi:hypothetical protein
MQSEPRWQRGSLKLRNEVNVVPVRYFLVPISVYQEPLGTVVMFLTGSNDTGDGADEDTDEQHLGHV